MSYSSKIIGLKADCYFLALGHRILDNVIKKSFSTLFSLVCFRSKQAKTSGRPIWR